jgi:hypothetical protein
MHYGQGHGRLYGPASPYSAQGPSTDDLLCLAVLRDAIYVADVNIAAASPIPSFLIECLIWNVPNDHFGHDSYTGEVRAALAFLFNNTMKFDDYKEWGEVNELKYLFRTVQPWTVEQAHAFLSAAWDYIGFK